MTELAPHLQALRVALRAEQDAEAAEHERLDALPLDERIEAGHTWPRVTLTAVDADGGRVRLRVEVGRGAVLHDGIGPGDPVWIDIGGERIPATVDDVDPRVAELVADRAHRDMLTALAGGSHRPEVSARHDPSTFVRYRQALERAGAHRSALSRALLDLGPTEITPQDYPIAGLNPAQRRAAHQALRTPDLALVWGPPGTGKTRLLGKVLAELVRSGDRPWALADSNAAVDHLARHALGEGLDVVRLGPISRTATDLREHRLDAKIERSLLGPALATLDRALGRAWGTTAAVRLMRERAELWDQARAETLARAQVIAATFGTLARVAEDLPRAGTAVIDEATQAMEPAVWVAVPYVERLVLAGDPAQLGPVVRVPDSPLAVSVLERWLGAGATLPMLEVQHRMAPALRELVAGVYGPDYVDAPAMAAQAPALDAGALWIDTAGAGGEQLDPVTRSLFEPLEVAVVALVVAQLVEAGVEARDIGVIAPYSAQVARLRAAPALAGAGVEVATVNAFQGREKQAMIVSFVRSNPERALGFVADPRRLTVALTRARRQLVLVGDTATLSAHPRFAELIDALGGRGALRSVWEPPWSDALATTG